MKNKFKVFPQNKTGWIRVVEAFVAVLLITGIILLILNKGYIKKDDPSEKIYGVENSILQEINNNDVLRNEVLGANPLPVNWTDIDPLIKNEINSKVPNYLDCISKICAIDDDCLAEETVQNNIYVRSSVITANNTVYSPRQIKLFCWMKE